MSRAGIQYLNYLFIFYFIKLAEGLHAVSADIENFDSDYYWKNPVVRAGEIPCSEGYFCIGGKCSCKEKSGTISKLRTAIQEVSPDNEDESTEHPPLRHHIAHFCPNLDVARQCIRKCMKIGKPAFCGKDHVCYCGHTYSSLDKEKPIKQDDTYNEFRDLYEKYFGPQSEESSREKGKDEGQGKLMLRFQK